MVIKSKETGWSSTPSDISSDYNACIMVLPKYTFVLLCSPFLSPLPHGRRFTVALLHDFMENLITGHLIPIIQLCQSELYGLNAH